MTTLVKVGKELKEIDLLSIFRPVEGEITLRYGRIGQGKTYGATVDVLDDLKTGKIVYTNWPITFDGIDQRESLFRIFASLLFPWASTFSVIDKSNWRLINIDENFIDTFSKSKNCIYYLDEGHVAFDSYEMTKMSMDKRVSVFHTRHFDRSINIVTQRPTAIHAVMRDNVNRFYKYEKLISKPFILFRRTEYQDLGSDGKPDEEQPLSVKLYLGSKRIYKAYNSKYLSTDTDYLIPNAQVFKLSYFRRIAQLFKLIFKPMFTKNPKKQILKKVLNAKKKRQKSKRAPE